MTDRVSIGVGVAGGELACYRLGAPASDAPLVLAIHGITSSSRNWVPAARELGDRAALIAVDLRGRAASSGLPAPYGVDADVADMIAVLDHFGLQRAVIAGHSLGAYIAARLAALHPERVRSLVLVDGGLTIPGSEDADPAAFMDAFLAPTLARLSMTFADASAYRDWWARHPALADAVRSGEIAHADLEEYAAHDLVGAPPQLRSSVNPEAIRADGTDLFHIPDARRIACPAVLLCAPRGLSDEPSPMQPLALAQSWADADPGRRRAIQVPDVNHYTIALGATGARAVAAAIAQAVTAEG
jgi:pimeloyl-ACP methyl ester carboxylesterase